MSETHFAATPIAVYGIILFMGGTAYYILQQLIIASQGAHSVLRDALAADWKGKGSGSFQAGASRGRSAGVTVLIEPVALDRDFVSIEGSVALVQNEYRRNRGAVARAD